MNGKTATHSITEQAEQIAFVEWFRWTYPDIAPLSTLGSFGENVGAFRGNTLNKMGYTKGFPDLVFYVPRETNVEHVISGQYGVKIVKQSKWVHGLFIEMKSKGGRVRPEQKEKHEALIENGYQVNVCHSFEEAKSVIDEYFGRRG